MNIWQKNVKKSKNGLTYGLKHCIIYKHELSVEIECGYITTEVGMEGTSMEHVMAETRR